MGNQSQKENTLIIGKRSALSSSKFFKESNILKLSSSDLNNSSLVNKINTGKSVNIIINLFYPSVALNKDIEISKYIDFTIYSLFQFLNKIDKRKITKIIYSSSSAVYGLANNIEKDSKRKLYALTKLNIEELLKEFCKKSLIKLTICRLFNIYSEKENFSFVSKILNQQKSQEAIRLFNGGSAVRDFIHIDDVAKIYKKILKSKHSKKFQILDVGTGVGTILGSLKDALPDNNFKIVSIKTDEIDISIANTENLINIIGIFKFKTFSDFFKQRKKTFVKKNIREIKNFDKNSLKKNEYIAIYGAGNAGKQVLKILKNNNSNLHFIFIDDDKKKVGKFIHNTRVISFNEFEKFVKYINFQQVIFSIPSADKILRLKLYKKLSKVTKKILTLPSHKVVFDDRIHKDDIKEIDYGDIFGRKIIKKNVESIKQFSNQVILVTGGAGSIGSALCKILIKNKFKKLIIVDQNETAMFYLSKELIVKEKKIKFVVGDITNENFMKFLVNSEKVNHIFHAAAYKHVNLSENNVIECINNNVFGTYNLINSINGSVKSFTMISTDKAARPSNMMGMSKRLSEIIAQNEFKKKNLKSVKLSIVRFGNVFGSNGSAIQIFMNQIKNGEKITVTHKDAERFFMTVEEACILVLNSSIMNSRDFIFILDMGRPIKIIKIVNDLINRFGDKSCYKKIKFIGLKRGEKLKEELSISKKKIKTPFKNVYKYKEPSYKKENIEKMFEEIIKHIKYNNQKDLKLLISNFLAREIA